MYPPARPQAAPTAPTANSNAFEATPEPRSAPPVPLPRRKARVPVPLAGRSVLSLENEIERLTAACEEHERAIRSSLSTVKHHLMTNLHGLFEKLNSTDEEAEGITASIQQSLQANLPTYQAHLRRTLEHRAGDVDIMRQRMTPWREVVPDPSAVPETGTGGVGEVVAGGVGEGSVRKKLRRVEGGGVEADALTRIELWADEIEMYLNNEIVNTNKSINARSVRQRLVIVAFVVLGAALAAGLAFVGLYYPAMFLWSVCRPWPGYLSEEWSRWRW
ncbi:hypothetical protein IAT38_001750 [Cryptococcus sp. DSM 104549]